MCIQIKWTYNGPCTTFSVQTLHHHYPLIKPNPEEFSLFDIMSSIQLHSTANTRWSWWITTNVEKKISEILCRFITVPKYFSTSQEKTNLFYGSMALSLWHTSRSFLFFIWTRRPKENCCLTRNQPTSPQRTKCFFRSSFNEPQTDMWS